MDKTKVLIEGYSHIVSYDLTVRDFKRYSRIIPIEVKSKLTREITKEDISWCDVLLVVRGDNPLSAYLSKKVTSLGKRVVLLLDDDLIEYRMGRPSLEGRVCGRSLLKVIENSTCIITTSKYLGEKYKRNYGRNYTLVDTVVEESQIKPVSPNLSGPVRMLYAASKGHRTFFDKYIKPDLNDLYKRYGEKVALTIIGPEIDTEGIDLRIEKIGTMPLEQYRSYMDQNHFDIGLAPLFDSELCRSKYFNKYLEYSVNGICGIYSNVLPYSLVVKDGVNGFLANDTPKAWFDAMCHAIDDAAKRRMCVENAQKHIRSEFTLKSIATKLYRDMPEVFSYKAENSQKIQIDNMRFKYLRTASYRNILKIIDRFKRGEGRQAIIEIYKHVKN